MIYNPIGTTFNSKQIRTFDEFKHFTSVTSVPNEAFSGSTLASIDLANMVSGGDRNIFSSTKLTYVWMPKVVTAGSTASQAYRCWFYNVNTLKAVRLDSATTVRMLAYNAGSYYLVCTMPSVPSGAGSNVTNIIYVPDGMVSEYQASSVWGSKTIRPLSQLPNDHPDCPWLDDLRAKGFID